MPHSIHLCMITSYKKQTLNTEKRKVCVDKCEHAYVKMTASKGKFLETVITNSLGLHNYIFISKLKQYILLFENYTLSNDL